MDTATTHTAVALLEDKQVLAEHQGAARNHSRTLLPAVDRLLRTQGLGPGDLEAVAVGVGPGSFTGVRVGLTLAKTIAFGLDVPLVGVSTLRALAENRADDIMRICPALDALKAEVYCAGYRADANDLRLVEPEAARDPRTWAAGLARDEGDCLLLGSGARRYRDVFTDVLGDRARIPGDDAPHRVRAAAVGLLARRRLQRGEQDDPRALEPNYCRLSEAELARTS